MVSGERAAKAPVEMILERDELVGKILAEQESVTLDRHNLACSADRPLNASAETDGVNRLELHVGEQFAKIFSKIYLYEL